MGVILLYNIDQMESFVIQGLHHLILLFLFIVTLYEIGVERDHFVFATYAN